MTQKFTMVKNGKTYGDYTVCQISRMLMAEIHKGRGKPMRKKKDSLNDYANKATAAGVTYGKKQAEEYAAKVKTGPVPDGYRKAGEFVRKKWKEDL